MSAKNILSWAWIVISCAWLIVQFVDIFSRWSRGDVPDLWTGVGLAIMPPAIVFGVGAGLAWAIEGFGIE